MLQDCGARGCFGRGVEGFQERCSLSCLLKHEQGFIRIFWGGRQDRIFQAKQHPCKNTEGWVGRKPSVGIVCFEQRLIWPQVLYSILFNSSKSPKDGSVIIPLSSLCWWCPQQWQYNWEPIRVLLQSLQGIQSWDNSPKLDMSELDWKCQSSSYPDQCFPMVLQASH